MPSRVFSWTLAAVLFSPVALATSSPFRAAQILNHPAHPDTFVVRSYSWGFIRSTDAGKTWQWSCSEVYGSKSVEDDASLRMILTASGRVLVANGFRGLRFTDDFCTWTRVEWLDDLLVADVAARGDTVMVVTSTGTDSGIENRLWTSADGGAHVVPFATDLPGGIAISSLAFAPSRPERAYALGLAVPGGEGALLRSDDGGRTFQRFSAPSSLAARVALRVAAVHPFEPDIVFAHVDVTAIASSDDPDELWVTGDGGESWRRVFAAQGDLPGFSFSPDASRFVLAGPTDGVHWGTVAGLVGDAGGALIQVNPRATWGLLWNSRGLYGGNDDFALTGHPEPYTLGLSHDEGATFEKVADICDFRFPSCASGTAGTISVKRAGAGSRATSRTRSSWPPVAASSMRVRRRRLLLRGIPMVANPRRRPVRHPAPAARPTAATVWSPCAFRAAAAVRSPMPGGPATGGSCSRGSRSVWYAAVARPDAAARVHALTVCGAMRPVGWPDPGISRSWPSGSLWPFRARAFRDPCRRR